MPIQPPGPCQHRRLVSNDICRVEHCSQGTIHLVLGDLTLRLREAHLHELCDALNEASARVGQRPLLS